MVQDEALENGGDDTFMLLLRRQLVDMLSRFIVDNKVLDGADESGFSMVPDDKLAATRCTARLHVLTPKEMEALLTKAFEAGRAESYGTKYGDYVKVRKPWWEQYCEVPSPTLTSEQIKALLEGQRKEAFGESKPHAEIAGERVETLERVARGGESGIRILLTTARAVMEKTRLPRTLAGARLEIRKGDTRRPDDLAKHLESIGFEEVEMVEDVAQFSRRGGIFDIYSFGMSEPVRLEFWVDDISELRHFDLLTQRSTRDAELALILPVDGAAPREDDETELVDDRTSIASLWPPDTLLIVPGATEVEGELNRTWTEAKHHIELARRRGAG
jgi:hypothetical protein